MIVSEIMSTNVITVRLGATIEEVAGLMAENGVSGIPVLDKDDKLVGIVTHKDLLYKDMNPRFPAVVELLGGLIYLQGVHKYNEELKKLVATKVDDIMTKHVITVKDDTKAEEAARIMVDKNINRIPVVRDGKLVGIVGRADIIKYMAHVTGV